MVVLLGAVALVLALSPVLGIGARLAQLKGWLAGLGGWGPVAFVVIYAAATVAALPGSVLTVMAGALFGTVLGVVLVSIGATAGASAAFLVSRYFARDAVARRLAANPRFQHLDELTRTHEALIVALTRLVPIFPFNLLNYGFGLTRVRFWPYVFWSWLCMLPGTVLYVSGADAVARGASERRVPWAIAAIAVAAAAAVALLSRYAGRALKSKGAAQNR